MSMSSYNKGATVKTTSSSPYLITEQLRWEGTSRDGLVQPSSSKQGQLELITQDLVHSGVVYIQGYFHNLSGQVCPVFDHSHNKKNLGFFSLCSSGISCISIFAHWLWSFQWAPLSRACLYLLHSPFPIRYLQTLIRSPQNFLQCKQCQLSRTLFMVLQGALSPQSSQWPFTRIPPVCPCLSRIRQPRTGCFTLVLTRGEGSPSSTCSQHSS